MIPNVKETVTLFGLDTNSCDEYRLIVISAKLIFLKINDLFSPTTLFIYLTIFCLCQTIYPVHSLNTLRSYPTVDDVTNTGDIWSLNNQNKKKTMDRIREFNRYLNSIFLRQQFYPEENEEPYESRKFSVLSNQNKRDYLFLRG
ncbi:unnamed protein product [Schistosoma rodhaini]|uniref:Uncharacterized protein n=1 Tax=Schistosoma rodhaini TaxID=6188 RepID=A0AA85FN67_9TREM|nr:unnamed protein product [Schistosoma rodhaini]